MSATEEMQIFDKVELLRQVEYYFSDENLQNDAHLLGRLQEGNGTVSIDQITGLVCMRKLRPLSAVKEALKESTVLEIINNKRIKRRQPFDMTKAKVKPRVDEDVRKVHKKATLEANPHIPKSMLKRTGFEYDHIEADLTVEEQQIELEQYSPEYPIYDRLETAVLKYKMNRKFHQETMKMFHAFLNYGGFDERPSSFSGGTRNEEEECLSKEEKARRKQVNYVSEAVMQSIDESDGKWVVDFKGVTKGFFSTPFPSTFLWHDDLKHDKEVTQAACNVLRNFFNYLIYHKVCPEFADQINAAREVLEVVEKEYVMLAEVQKNFPGTFNIACSTLKDGYYSKIYPQGTWMTAEEAAASEKGYTRDEALSIVNAGIVAFATQEDALTTCKKPIQVSKVEEDAGFEVTGIVLPAETSQEQQEFFDKLKGTLVTPMGKLLCKRYHFEKAPPLDVPAGYTAGLQQSFQFIFDQEALRKCFVGMKFIATVKEISWDSTSLWFIDHWSECYGTFYTWCWNERAKEYKENRDPFKLAKPKHEAGNVHVALMGEGTMLENTVHDGEQVSDANLGQAVGEQDLQLHVTPGSEQDLQSRIASGPEQIEGNDDITLKYKRKTEDRTSTSSDEGFIVIDPPRGTDTSIPETPKDNDGVSDFVSLERGSAVTVVVDGKECDVAVGDGGFFGDEEDDD